MALSGSDDGNRFNAISRKFARCGPLRKAVVLLCVCVLFLYLTTSWDVISLNWSIIPAPPAMYTDCESDLPADDKHRMAVVIAMIPSQIPLVRYQIETWKKYSPCVSDDMASKINLYFYFALSLSDPEVAEAVELLKKELAQADTKCFGKYDFLSANMSPEAASNSFTLDFLTTAPSTLGTVNQFYHLAIDDQVFSANYRYFYWMEPDVIPVKKGWAEALYRDTLGQRSFWVRGSIIQYDRPYSLAWRPFRDQYAYHINGNALYRNDDACFKKFLSAVREEYYDIPFDLSIHYYRNSANHFNIMQKTAHRFEFTAQIMDVGSYAVLETVPSTAYMVHGKGQYYKYLAEKEASGKF